MLSGRVSLWVILHLEDEDSKEFSRASWLGLLTECTKGLKEESRSALGIRAHDYLVNVRIHLNTYMPKRKCLSWPCLCPKERSVESDRDAGDRGWAGLLLAGPPWGKSSPVLIFLSLPPIPEDEYAMTL